VIENFNLAQYPDITGKKIFEAEIQVFPIMGAVNMPATVVGQAIRLPKSNLPRATSVAASSGGTVPVVVRATAGNIHTSVVSLMGIPGNRYTFETTAATEVAIYKTHKSGRTKGDQTDEWMD